MKYTYYLLIIFTTIISCKNKSTDENNLTQKKILKLNSITFLKPFKYKIKQNIGKSTGYIIPYIYSIENTSDSQIFSVNIESKIEIITINNIENYQILPFTNIPDIPNKFDDFNPLLPNKSFNCVGYLKFIEKGSDYISVGDDGKLYKYLNSEIPIQTSFSIKSLVKTNQPNGYGYESEILYNNNQNLVRNLLSFKNNEFKDFGYDDILNRKTYQPDYVIYNYLYDIINNKNIVTDENVIFHKKF